MVLIADSINVQVEYKLKWKNFPSSQNSWVNINQMSCPQLIEEFELEQMANIVGKNHWIIWNIQ